MRDKKFLKICIYIFDIFVTLLKMKESNFGPKNGVQNGGHPRPGRPEGVQKWGRVGVRATFGGPKLGPKRGSKTKWAIFLNIENKACTSTRRGCWCKIEFQKMGRKRVPKGGPKWGPKW